MSIHLRLAAPHSISPKRRSNGPTFLHHFGRLLQVDENKHLVIQAGHVSRSTSADKWRHLWRIFGLSGLFGQINLASTKTTADRLPDSGLRRNGSCPALAVVTTVAMKTTNVEKEIADAAQNKASFGGFLIEHHQTFR